MDIILPTREEFSNYAAMYVGDKPYPAVNYNSFMAGYDTLIKEIKHLNKEKTFKLELTKEQ